MIFRVSVNKKSREESGTSQPGTNTLQGLLIITDVINIMKLTHSMCQFVNNPLSDCNFGVTGIICIMKLTLRVCFWGIFSKKE